jgi:hypothetical protein
MAEKLSELVRLKNLVRGAFASLQNHVPAKTVGAAVAQDRAATSALKQALGKARSKLSGRDLELFEQWVDAQQKALHWQDDIGTSKTLLGLLPDSIGKRRLAEVLTLTQESLTRARESLREFKSQLSDINSLLCQEHYQEALSAVKSVTDKYGYSFWAIEASIAILSSMGRQAEVTNYIKELSAGAVGLNSFYLYYFGLRNETSQSAARLRSIINKRLNDSKLEQEYRAYAEYRTARVVPLARADVAAILSYEQLTTKIDMLLTAERLAIEILGNWNRFDDQELELARNILKIASDQAMVDGTGFLRLPPNLHIAIESGVAAAIAGDMPSASSATAKLLTLGIAATISYSGNEVDEEALRKLLMNYWWLDDAIALDSAGQLPRLPDLHARQWSISGPDSHPAVRAIVDCFSELENTSKLLGNSDATTVVPEAPLWDASYSHAVIDCIAVKSAWRAFEDDYYNVALRVIQFALLHNNRLLGSLPLDRMFKGVEFNRVKSYGISVDLCNCLHWYSQVNSERQIRTFKRFAIEEWIELDGAPGLIDAAKKLRTTRYNQQLVEYFLANTCDVGVIELLLEIDGTRQALEVRSELLRLASQGSNSVAQLTAEAESITERLEVDDVLGELDETKVSVDEEALLPVVAREISADFDRYKQLLSASSTTGGSLSDLVQSIRQQSPAAFQIPKSEAGDLLVQMIQSVLDLFMEDPVYGLDAIIGRRIRHGTISSELRGTLEHMHLIGQRPRTGADYDVPGPVAHFLSRYDPNIRRGATRAFGRFSEGIDRLVSQLRDEVFQTKKRGRLKAAFELPLSVTMFAVGRDAAATVSSAEQFVRELFDAFWFLLSTYAERERIEAKDFIESTTQEIFTKFLADLRGAKINDAPFLASVQQASEELQRRADVISGWIRIPKVIQEGRVLPMGTVFDAAMAMCKARRPGFEPVSLEDIDKSISLDAHGYPIVFDALCIALENVAQHSGIKRGNRVETSIKLSDDKELIHFSIESDVSKDAWSKEKSQKVDSIRDEINRRAFADRAKRTSGSGLAKLATIVKQRPHCKIEFGATSKTQRFRLDFDLAFISHASLLGVQPESLYVHEAA